MKTGSRQRARDDVAAVRKQAWSPLEVWRTRVKTPAQLNRTEPSPDLELTRAAACAAAAEHIQSSL